MKKILLLTKTLDPAIITAGISDLEVKQVVTKLELVEAIVGENDLLGVLIEWEAGEQELRSFLRSLKRSFPILRIGLITPPAEIELPGGYRQIDSGSGVEMIKKEVQKFLSSITDTDQREHHRFDWPLQGYLTFNQETWQNYRVRSLSATGAFLECSSSFPNPGMAGLLRIVFQDFKMLVSCDILDPRQASSNLPPGFGVRFSDLTDASIVVLDRIVNDTLIHTLLEPDSEPAAPTIGEEEPLTASFELL